ncbi:MAG: type I restriction enzyme HsdR N-terminal domain-containing protein [Paludibacteraceae bacterium]|jgi:predicted type IV restriction endonuclease|nr:type I restriction enzyme HsdR N-terminal domain-containing protein [Paludibacteraceae bacterium]
MNVLNFPDYQFKIRVQHTRREIFDEIRKKWVALQPEELVRQNMVRYLREEKGYPATHIANEVSVELNGMRKRCDTVVYDGTGRPLMLIEYKAPTIAITQKTFDQILTYNTEMKVAWLLVSNGLQHIVCRAEGKQVEFYEEIPPYDRLY